MATAVHINPSLGEGRPYDPPKRSKAVPKHSLFGSDLENFDEKDKEDISRIDVKKYQEEKEKERLKQENRYKASLPTHLKSNIDDLGIKGTRQDVEFQLDKSTKAKGNLVALENKSRFFQLGVANSSNNNQYVNDGTKGHDQNALQHAEQINSVRLRADKPSYNRDKYQEPGVSHQYSLIGDPLKLGMEQDNRKSTDNPNTDRPQYKRYRAPDWLPKESFMKESKDNSDLGLAVNLPSNILHQFGTKICQDVLKDKSLVEESLETQARIRASSNRSRSSLKNEPIKLDSVNPDYEELSQVVRQNIFPGYTPDNKVSSTKSTFTRDVFDRRVPDPDQWRCQRDELTIWNEHRVISDRLRKQWNIFDENRPRYTANWDRNAKRPPPKPKPLDPKPKAKPKLKKAAKKDDDDFPVIEFVTPPLTPPPGPPEKIPALYQEEDEEFWDFYDQPVPK